MDTLTVRRWIDEPQRVVWRRLSDLDALIDHEPALELREVVGERWTGGSMAVIGRHHGPRVSLLQVRVIEAHAPRRLTLSVTGRRTRWVVVVTVAAFGAHCSDVVIRAHRDVTGWPMVLPLHLSASARRLEQDLTDLLASLAKQAAPASG